MKQKENDTLNSIVLEIPLTAALWRATSGAQC